MKIAQERKEQETRVIEIQKEKAILVAQEEKNQAAEIAKIERETRVAEQLKHKLVMLEETAKQESLKIRAEEQAITTQAVEVANRAKEIDVINAKKEASVNVAKNNVAVDTEAYKLITVSQARLEAAGIDLEAANKQAQTEIIEAEKKAKVNVIVTNAEADKEAYRLITVAKAKKEAADLDLAAAIQQAKAILEIGNANISNTAAQLGAENTIGKNTMIMQALNQLIPLLPQIIEKLMLPAEKIDSIKFLHINGMNGIGASQGQAGDGGGIVPANTGGIIQTMFNVSMLLPVMKEVIKTLRNDTDMGDILQLVERIPGGESLLNFIEKSKADDLQQP